MKARKLHLRKEFDECSLHARCGAWIFDERPALTDRQYVWLPRESQCGSCLNLWNPKPMRHSATPLMLTTIEVVLIAFADWCRYVDAQGDHAERGCYFPIDSDSCWCGRMTATNPAFNAMCARYAGDEVLRSLGWAASLQGIYKKPHRPICEGREP